MFGLRALVVELTNLFKPFSYIKGSDPLLGWLGMRAHEYGLKEPLLSVTTGLG